LYDIIKIKNKEFFMENEDFEIEKGKIPGKLIIKGRINTINAPMLESEIINTLNEGNKHIILDLSRVSYLSSTGIRVILKTFKQANLSGGKLNIEHPSENVKNVLGMAALEEMLLK